MMQAASTNSYPPPLDQLLTYGKIEDSNPATWANYLELGFGPEHIPDLARMAADENLNDADSDSLEVWAPVHAWRALGQLRDATAIEPLISLLTTLANNEWAMEELPEVFGLIGSPALPQLTECIADSSQNEWARITAINAVEKIGTRWPNVRAESVKLLTTELEKFATNDYEINALLISSLVDMHAIESAPTIEKAFAANRVDESVMGDWDDVQVEMGLKSMEEVALLRGGERQTSDWPTALFRETTALSSEIPSQLYTKSHPKNVSARKKTKQKMAKMSRKRNKKR